MSAENEDQKEPPKAAEPSHASDTTSRRGALSVLVGAGSLAYAGALGAIGAAFVTSEGGGGRTERWIRVGRVTDLPEGEPRRVPIVGDARDAFTVSRAEMLGSVWLVREGNNVRALSATCPHLGCAIDLAPDKKAFSCPCHSSRFALAGEPIEGPSPRSMDSLETRTADGFVEVSFRKYRQGVSKKEEV